MIHRARATRRSVPQATALLAALAVLVSLFLPTGTAWAAESAAPATSVAPATSAESNESGKSVESGKSAESGAAGDCSPLATAPLGGTGEARADVTIPAGGTACLTVDVERPGMHRVMSRELTQVYVSVFDGDQRLECYDPAWYSHGWCDLPRTGTYRIEVLNDTVTEVRESVVVVPLAVDGPCADEIPTSWDSPVVTGSAPDAFAILCHRVSAKAGERLLVEAGAHYTSTEKWITDESGARICPPRYDDNSTGCVLPGDGPYRVYVRVGSAEAGFPAAYTLKVRRLSDPAGCATVPVNAYGSAPTSVEPAASCKLFTASPSGRYDVYEADGTSRTRLAVYDSAGRTVCESWLLCTVPTAGQYTVLTERPTLILDRASSDGCRPTELGVHEGTLTVPGEVDCLTLPLPEGATVAALTALSGTSFGADLTVYDADGEHRCSSDSLRAGTCALTGPGPHQVLVSTDSESHPTGSYRFALYRTDGTGDGCRVFPAGDFTATTASARFATGGGVFSDCLTIPADDHSTGENIQLRAVSGTANAEFTVLDAKGKQVCSVWPHRTTWTHCALTPGLAHTVLATGSTATAEYTLTRRDVTATAKGCVPTPATAVGGPSTAGVPGAPGTLVCHQVTTADAADTLHLDVRDPLGTTNVAAHGPDGSVTTCPFRNRACAVTGADRYQVLLAVPSHLKAADSYRFDAQRIATAAGPAPECVKVPNITYGYGPITGTLDEQHTAICAELPTSYHDYFTVKVSDTAGAAQTAVPSLYDENHEQRCSARSTGEYSCALSGSYTTETTPSLFVLGLPEKASQTSYRAQIVCPSRCGTERIGVTEVTPDTGVTGTKVAVAVKGSALPDSTRVVIASGDRRVEATGVTVAPDRRSLTAVLDLAGVPTGTWYLSVYASGMQFGSRAFTVTPQAPLANTAAPVVSGTAQAGATVSAQPGTWSPAPTSYTYQWKADGVAVAGATAATYAVPADLVGKRLSVTVTAHRAGNLSTAATSAAVTVAPGAAPRATAAPSVYGTVRVGTQVSVRPGTWSPAATSYAYQWRIDGARIRGAGAATYVPTAADLGKKLSVTVTAHRTGHQSGTAGSAAVVVARGVAPKATTLPKVSGTAKVGRTLTAGRGAWTPAPTSYAYQWYANGRVITGATKSTFVPTRAQRGTRITVRVTAHRTGHHSGTALSAATAAVVS